MKPATISLHYPFTGEKVRALNVGDTVKIAGLVFTGRDRLHKHLAETHHSQVDLRDGAIFHCGLVVKRDNAGSWRIVAAGPTTSIREEPYMATIVAEQGVRVVIGKGGLGEGSLAAFAKHGCAYIQAVGGAAAVIAETVKEVIAVHFLEEFGATEAMWVLRVDGLEGIVGMDAHGHSLYDVTTLASKQALDALLNRNSN